MLKSFKIVEKFMSILLFFRDLFCSKLDGEFTNKNWLTYYCYAKFFIITLLK